jgi:gliding motility-associated-like protein
MSSTFGLPNFVQSYLNPITYVNACNGNTSFSVFTGVDSVIWNFNDPVSGINNSSSTLNPSHFYTNAGTYSVSAITYSGSVKDTLTINVVISKPPSVDLGNDIILCTNNELILDAGSGYENYYWQNSATAQRDTASIEGLYYVNVSNICGIASDTIFVRVEDCTAKSNDKIDLPNIFTPNGDGVNDLFRIQNLPDGIAPLKIYDRSGEIVFQTEGYNNDWDGNDINSGVYYYILSYPPNEKTYTGFVQVLSDK